METETVKTVKHTPLPWDIRYTGGIDYKIISDNSMIVEGLFPSDSYESMAEHEEEWIANGKFIVRACNSHYELLEALKKAHNFIDVFKNKMGRALPKDWNDAMSAGLIDMNEAIKKATS